MKFNSQICTSKSQSERLLALGLKIETANCYYWQETDRYGDGNGKWHCEILSEYNKDHNEYLYNVCGVDGSDEGFFIPAWSLGRLVEDLMPQTVTYRLNDYYLSLYLGEGMIGYFPPRLSARIRALEYFYGNDTILDDCISCIEWLIKEGYFNKEYLDK